MPSDGIDWTVVKLTAENAATGTLGPRLYGPPAAVRRVDFSVPLFGGRAASLEEAIRAVTVYREDDDGTV